MSADEFTDLNEQFDASDNEIAARANPSIPPMLFVLAADQLARLPDIRKAEAEACKRSGRAQLCDTIDAYKATPEGKAERRADYAQEIATEQGREVRPYRHHDEADRPQAKRDRDRQAQTRHRASLTDAERDRIKAEDCERKARARLTTTPEERVREAERKKLARAAAKARQQSATF